MNIAFFSKQLPSDEPNGVSVQVHRLAVALSGRGHRITVFTFSSPVTGAPYRCVVLKSRGLPGFLRKFEPALRFRKVDTWPFDVLHYHGDDYLSAGSVRRIRTFYGSALQEALHAGRPARFLYQALFYVLEWVSSLKKGHAVAISEDTRRYLPFVKECVPCAVPLDRFIPGEMKSRQPSILFIGDFHSRKRGNTLLETFERVILPARPDCTLSVAGPVPCTGKNVEYLGRIDEETLIRAYRRSWIFCMPSSYEGFGVPMLEAMACGTAVVATRNPGSETLIRHGINGLLTTPDLLGTTILRLIGNAGERAALAAEGVRTAEGFDIERIADRYERIYSDLNRTINLG